MRPLAVILLLLAPFALAAGEGDPAKDLKKVVASVRKGMRKVGLAEKDLPPRHDYLPADAWRLELVDSYLSEPLTVPEDAYRRFTALLDSPLREAGRCLGIPDKPGPAASPAQIENTLLATTKDLVTLPRPAKAWLARLLKALAAAVAERRAAFSKLTEEEWVRLRQYGSQFNTGIPPAMQADFLRGLHARIDRARLHHAAIALLAVVEDFPANLPADGPDFHRVYETPHGRVEIGGWGRNHYEKDCLLTVDFGGDDVYANSAGGTLYTEEKVSVAVDFAGNDVYRTTVGLAQGSGMYGIGILLDAAGDDLYESKNVSQGSGHVGVGVLHDLAGDDRYVARAMSQGTGFQGVGILRDDGGRDVYRLGVQGQGYGGVEGLGLLLDRSGDDSYRAGGLQPDRPREPDRFLSLAQGFGHGIRAEGQGLLVSGGIGVLADLDGDDSYEADVFGQGCAYWYALGVLLDFAGRDFYEVHNYGQGAGIHMAVGVQMDFAGDDRYVGSGHALGHSLDRSVGFFADFAGNDLYESADWESQGAAVKPFAVGMFADLRGDDTYRGGGNGYVREPEKGREEEWPKAFFIDFGGTDIYPLGDRAPGEGKEWVVHRLGWGRDQ